MANNYFEQVIEKYRYLIFSIITGLVALSTKITNPILDSNYLFHEGEYVGLLWNMRSYYNGEVHFPLLIHGAMDYLPSIFASFIYGDDYIIVGTRGINTIISWLCWVIFFDLCYSITTKKSSHFSWFLLITTIFILISPRLNEFALNIQQSFLGPRDIFIIISIWCFYRIIEEKSLICERIFLIIGTSSVVFAMFWSYDRGILALAFLAMIFIGMIKNKETLNILLLVITVTFGLFILDYSNIVGPLSENINNIFYWVKNSKEVFGLGFFEVGVYNLITTILVLFFCFSTIIFSFLNISTETKKSFFVVIGLIAIQILLLKTIINRPGLPRLLWAIWPSILLLLYFGSQRILINFTLPNFSVAKPTFIACKLFVLPFLFLIFMVNSTISPFWYGSFIKNIFKPKPDVEIVSTEIIDLNRFMNQFPEKCFFGWVNEGVIALMSKKRFCTEYPYATYVSKSEEIKLLQQLKSDSPNSIVFEITGNSLANIDGRSMRSRLPIVDEFIQENYQRRHQIGRYLVVSK